MKILLLFIVTVALCSCENNTFDSDKRQLIAKSEVREKLKNIRSFDITGFKEDTLHQSTDPRFGNPIRYNLHIMYKDSTGKLQNKEAFVLFTPDGKSVISSQINN